MNDQDNRIFSFRDDFNYESSKDGITIFDNVFPDGFCNKIIECFDTLEEKKYTHNRQESEHAPPTVKNDNAIELNSIRHSGSVPIVNDLKYIDYFTYENKPVNDVFHEGLGCCFQLYKNDWPGLHDRNHNSFYMKVQRTPPGGGYHIRHYEHGPGYNSLRSAVFILYLNTLGPDAAGETEFLHQEKRISPLENRLVIWPAGYMHLHRGNVVYGNKSKYVVTGWFDLTD